MPSRAPATTRRCRWRPCTAEVGPGCRAPRRGRRGGRRRHIGPGLQVPDGHGCRRRVRPGVGTAVVHRLEVGDHHGRLIGRGRRGVRRLPQDADRGQGGGDVLVVLDEVRRHPGEIDPHREPEPVGRCSVGCRCSSTRCRGIGHRPSVRRTPVAGRTGPPGGTAGPLRRVRHHDHQALERGGRLGLRGPQRDLERHARMIGHRRLVQVHTRHPERSDDGDPLDGTVDEHRGAAREDHLGRHPQGHRHHQQDQGHPVATERRSRRRGPGRRRLPLTSVGHGLLGHLAPPPGAGLSSRIPRRCRTPGRPGPPPARGRVRPGPGP